MHCTYLAKFWELPCTPIDQCLNVLLFCCILLRFFLFSAICAVSCLLVVTYRGITVCSARCDVCLFDPVLHRVFASCAHCSAQLGKHIPFAATCLQHGFCCTGCVKMTQPTAMVTAFLAWSLLSFPSGYNKASNTAEAEAAVRWGSDYLLKLFRPTVGSDYTRGVTIIYQVRQIT